jgi:predicted metal-dependent hydrolase
MTSLKLGSITVDVVKKDIRNVHLSVYPPVGKVRISAPLRMNVETIRLFAVSKLGWIKEQQKQIVNQEREPAREYLERESHYFWGRRYLLKVIEKNEPPLIDLRHRALIMQVRPGATVERKQEILEEWYRTQLKSAIPPLIAKWEPVMGVRVARFFVQRMKTKWGSCSRTSAGIRLNSDLAKKPLACLEYVLVHEMTHLLEPTHNNHFLALMDRFLPNWRFHKEALNRLPVRHENWKY